MHHSPTARSTSAPLIILTLLAGMALGWLLNDLLAGAFGRSGASLTPGAPSATPVAILPSASPAPTQLPTLAPTEQIVPSAAPAPTAAPTVPPPSPTAPAISGYLGHVLAEGEALADIAAAAGSSAELIARYNRLTGAGEAGRALIVPQLAGQPATLASQPLLVRRGSPARPWVALTLDAGAGAAPVPDMLATLRERGVRITFFLTGKWIGENPELTRQIVADGHEIANHTQSHPDMRNLSDAAMRAELADTEALLEATAGASTRPLFRPPYGAYDERVLRLVVAEGYLPVYWTLDSLDSVGEPKTPAFLVERVTGALSPEQLRGAIILAHCGSQPTAEALPAILDRFAALGLEVRTLSEVLGG